MNAMDKIVTRMGLLDAWLAWRLTTEQKVWLKDQIARIGGEQSGTTLAMAIGLVPRKLGKADLALDATEIEAATKLRPGLDPSGWSVDQAARILFVLASFDGDDAAFAASFGSLMTQGELGEHIALLRGLPLYPAPRRLVTWAAEGVRSAVQPVFEAVAHANPFPREEFSETQWNHMVLKALFIGSRLAPIQGLDERRDADLAKMLMDYAHERWAAGRSVSPELWRCVGPFANEAGVKDLGKVLTEGSAAEQQAAALALAECPLPSAQAALASKPDLTEAIMQGRIAWQTIG
jgi:hypothetical protein